MLDDAPKNSFDGMLLAVPGESAFSPREGAFSAMKTKQQLYDPLISGFSLSRDAAFQGVKQDLYNPLTSGFSLDDGKNP